MAFADDEWKALYVAPRKATNIADHPPTLATAVILAGLGGFLARRGDGNPSVKAVFRGIRRLENGTTMWQLLGKPRSG